MHADNGRRELLTPMAAGRGRGAGHPPRSRAWPAVVVSAVGIVLAAVQMHVSMRYAPPLPFWDDWEVVPYVTGHEPVTLSWLWSHQNEHRILLPRLAYLGIARAFDYDTRAFALVGVAILFGLTALSLWIVRRLRGRIVLSDVFFPLLLLHLNHSVNTTWPIQIWYFMQATLLFLLMTAVLFHDDRCPWRTAWLAGVPLAAMPISGSFGLPAAFLLSPWLLWMSGRAWRRSPVPARGAAIVGGGLALGCLTLIGLYFLGMSTRGGTALIPNGLVEGGKVLAGGFGRAVRDAWPASGVAAAFLAALAAGLPLKAAFGATGERTRAIGMLLAVGGIVGVAVAVGWTRGGVSEDFVWFRRYVIIVCLWPWLLYLGAELYAGPGLRRAIQVVLAAISLVLFWPNTMGGLKFLHARLVPYEEILLDVREGRSLDAIAERHGNWWYPNRSIFRVRLEMLAEARMHPYAKTPPPHLLGMTPALAALVPERQGLPDTGGPLPIADEHSLVLAHAPSLFTGDVPDGARSLRVVFGLLPGAYTNGGATDGVTFRIHLTIGDEPRVSIWSRSLRPREAPSDRGLQLIDLELPPGAFRRLTLETHPGDAGDPSWDWSYWTGLTYRYETGGR